MSINRRNFLLSLGASATMPALAQISHTDERGASTDMQRTRVDLNGAWERLVQNRHFDVIAVPSSNRPIGQSMLRREFTLPKLGPGMRAFVHFEAITYFGRVSVNGAELGTMGPYTPYEFDFTKHVKEGANSISLQLADLIPFAGGAGRDEIALGVNPGWEAYSGIIRDVWVELRPATFIDDVRFGYTFEKGLSRARCIAQVMTSTTAAGAGEVSLRLFRNDGEAGHAVETTRLTAGSGEVELRFDVESPALWSPETPVLYRLEASLKSGDSADSWSCRTGFREMKAVGREFQLNGERCVLHGVCRHDMWKDQGFTLTRAQQRQDMQMIKDLGCNYVRLVHYPHDRRIVELADEIGLMVSEEPGYWIMDFRTMPRGEIELGWEILERTIRRDWNSPSVVAWLLSNECWQTTAVLKEGKRRCNAIDPLRRLVSAANNKRKEITKPMYEEAGMDFFDQHPYTFNIENFEKEADFDGPGKPLTFTEWGGKAIGQGLPIMQDSVNMIMKLEKEGKLSGTSFWSWQDVRQYSRADPEMHDGILESGVVTESREPRSEVYMELKRLFEGRPQYPLVEPHPKVLPLRQIPWSARSALSPVPLDKVLVANAEGWKAFSAAMARYWPLAERAEDQWTRTGSKFEWWQETQREMLVAGAPFRPALVDGRVRPIMVGNGYDVEISIPRRCSRLHILGNIALPVGYPISGQAGEISASYELRTSTGKVKELPLRWGLEIAQGNMIHEGTRILPVAVLAPPAISYVKDVAREQYQVLLYSTPAFESDQIASLRCRVPVAGTWLAIFAVTAEFNGRA